MSLLGLCQGRIQYPEEVRTCRDVDGFDNENQAAMTGSFNLGGQYRFRAYSGGTYLHYRYINVHEPQLHPHIAPAAAHARRHRFTFTPFSSISPPLSRISSAISK